MDVQGFNGQVPRAGRGAYSSYRETVGRGGEVINRESELGCEIRKVFGIGKVRAG